MSLSCASETGTIGPLVVSVPLFCHPTTRTHEKNTPCRIEASVIFANYGITACVQSYTAIGTGSDLSKIWKSDKSKGITFVIRWENRKWKMDSTVTSTTETIVKKYSGTSVHELNSFLVAVREPKCS
jgi:hypothetical protein